MNSFSYFNPFSLFIFFICIILISIIINNPICILISVLCAFVLCILLKGASCIKLVFGFIMLIPMSAVFNVLFNHKGASILFYFTNGNPATLESIIYGLYSGLVFCCISLWLLLFNFVFTADKLNYLLGKLSPNISILFSMTIRFIPSFAFELKNIYKGQKALGIYNESGFLNKIKAGVRNISVFITSSFENSITTSNSMKARGYGLKGRTNFHMYSFKIKDFILIFISVLLFIFIMFGYKHVYTVYFPYIKIPYTDLKCMVVYFLFTLLCMIPSIIEVGDRIKWTLLKLKI